MRKRRHDRLGDQLSDRHRRHAVVVLLGLDFLYIQEIVDQADQAFAVFVRDIDQALGFRWDIANRAALDQGQRSENRCQRCAQFMTYRSDEIVLEALELPPSRDIGAN